MLEWQRHRLPSTGSPRRKVHHQLFDMRNFVGAKAELERMDPRLLQFMAAARRECASKSNGRTGLGFEAPAGSCCIDLCIGQSGTLGFFQQAGRYVVAQASTN